MNKKCLVSVVVPVYNSEKTIDKCLQCLVEQSYKAYEIIVIDDGSTDKSGEKCDNWASNYSVINVIHKKNEGSGYARNTGIKAATGEYVVFVDSDDYYDLGLIEHLVEGKQDDADAVLSGYTRVSADGEILNVYKYQPTIMVGEQIKNELICRMVGSSPELHDSIDSGSTHVLFSLSVIRNNNLFFPSEREYISEDLLFNISFYRYAKKVILIDSADYYYVSTEGSLTKKYREDRFEKVIKLYEKEREILLSLGILDVSIVRAQKAFFNWIKMCFAQEKTSISGKTKKDQREAIKTICNNQTVRQTIQEYPISRLQLKQRFFLYLIKMRAISIISAFVEHEIITV